MRALILMTRIPIPGQTKTRLMDIFSKESCAEIHRCFLLDLFHMFTYIKDDIDIFITYTPEDSYHILGEIVPDYIKTFPQEGDNLGERMEKAIENVLNKGYKDVILIGSDIPDIQPMEIRAGFSALEDNDICLGPTFDGGYYLIGMKKVYRDLFNNNVKWGKKSVLEGTIDIANNIGLKVKLVSKHMDIDTGEDILAFKRKIDSKEFIGKIMPENTIDYINEFWSELKYAKG